jgi:RNA polymerase sigma-70 factor (ECF subfamily)
MDGSIELTVLDVHEDGLGGLLTRCSWGDSAAFTSLYDSIVGHVYGLSLRVLRDHFHPEEVTHDSFIEIWLCAGRFDPSRGSAQAWIFTIAHRKAVDRVRALTTARTRETRYHRLNHVGEFDSTGELAMRNVECESVRAMMSRLTEGQAIELAYFKGLTHSEVATALQVPLGTAKTRIRDGLIRLRGEWANPDVSGSSQQGSLRRGPGAPNGG